MKHICPTCNRIVNEDHVCENKVKRKDTRRKQISVDSRWRKIRQQVRERDLCCVLCFLNGHFNNGKEVHHIIERSADDSEENVFNPDKCVYLCSDCHRNKVHETRDSWKDYIDIFNKYIKEKNGKN